MDLLRPELYRLVRLFDVRSRKFLQGKQLGGVQKRGKGRGMEFRDVREYVTGDDIRLIDWNVTSRTGNIHVKEFYQERDIPVLVFVDLSSSITLDSTLVDCAFQLTLFLGLLHKRAGNRLQILGYGTKWEFVSEPIRSIPDLWRCARALQTRIQELQADSVTRTDHTLPLSYLQNHTGLHHIAYILTDGSGYPELERFRSLKNRHEIHCFQLTLPPPQLYLGEWSRYFFHTDSETDPLIQATGYPWDTRSRDSARAQDFFKTRFYPFAVEQDWIQSITVVLGRSV